MPQSELTFTPIDPAPKKSLTFTPFNSDGSAAIRSVFPGATITSEHRTNHVGYQTDDHHLSRGAVDMLPVKGMTFEQARQKLVDAGYPIILALDEVKHPDKRATGKHWHFAIGEREGRAGQGSLTFTPAAPTRQLKFTPTGGVPLKVPKKAKAAPEYSRPSERQKGSQRPGNRPPRPSDDPSLLSAAWLGFKNIPDSAW